MSKLWEKGVLLHKSIERFTVGNDPELDLALVPFDCTASKAHATMLGEMGYLKGDEVMQLVVALDQIILLHEKGDFKISVSQEDCHTAIENYLVREVGEVGKKIHTARSRNDQVLTALRLYYKDELNKIKALAEQWIDTLNQFAKEKENIDFPGYTHMQKAMPSSISMWAGAYVDSMKDDLKILNVAKELIDQSPLGSAAGYGVPIKIDIEKTGKELGFAKVQKNPIACQLSRGKLELSLLHCLSQLLLTINRLASDLIQFSMTEFGYFSLPEEFCTGSSIMPQKRNPDVLELLRGSYHVLLGYETQVKTLTANLISGYNRDIQLSKEPVMRGIKLVKVCLGISAAVVSGLKVNKDKCLTAMTEELYATEKAYKMVKEGIPFREAYRKVAESIKDRK
ncbi:MAG: argininosuccinate lyase [Candidatus Marinimicrobia bacterium]|nr:argininosuccinate lyase [Candidatus Neomarinimicrobiota bacterium]MBT3675673.1 argininosuccinate lyase [Candidatus Neomarinimicrobiota bacterium]MBT3764086.1 argininosuccinate lyase [Candidatus Neomarinimicrobiota bacterium]MBT4067192.1 argininosuccinate lyase [Candidatus Neomarinimicrobiota bacterium]MBT4270921.1 argininosuccinate lyase [Candidatus Neomarinimicrobiota bacterium]